MPIEKTPPQKPKKDRVGVAQKTAAHPSLSTTNIFKIKNRPLHNRSNNLQGKKEKTSPKRSL